MAADLDVFVVLNERTGLWDAACCNSACADSILGVHPVVDDNKTQAEALLAANQHRAEIRREIAEKAVRARQAEQGSALYWQDVARQRQRELARAERDLERVSALITKVRDLAEQARPSIVAACTCWDCEDEEKPNCGQGRAIAWNLDPAAVLAALDVPADGEQTGGGNG
jgi:hypothetical protein